MRHRPQKDIIVKAALLEDLWQRSRVAETIYIESGLGSNAKFFFEVALSIQTMADKRFPCRDIAIRFHPPTADNAPTPFLHALLDICKHRGI